MINSLDYISKYYRKLESSRKSIEDIINSKPTEHRYTEKLNKLLLRVEENIDFCSTVEIKVSNNK